MNLDGQIYISPYRMVSGFRSNACSRAVKLIEAAHDTMCKQSTLDH